MVEPQSKPKLDELEQLTVNGQFFLTIISRDIQDKCALIAEHIARGAAVNEVYSQYKLNTPLHIATGYGETDVVSLLLASGGMNNKPNSDNQTPLDVAIDLGDKGIDIRLMLIEKGAISRAIAKPVPLPATSTQIKVKENKSKQKKTKGHKLTRRAGTSGAAGQLYESKILCLVFRRAITFSDIIEFYLGSNIKGVGDLDDVCLKYKLTKDGEEKTIYLFLQAKHRDDLDKGKVTVEDLQSANGDFSYAKYFSSYLDIRKSISPSSTDVFFKENIDKVECNYVLYTSAREAIGTRKKAINDSENRMSERIDDLILTGPDHTGVFRFDYGDLDIHVLTNIIIKEDMKILGKKLLDFIVKKKSNEMMTDDLIKKYHVILATRVINLTRSVHDKNKVVGAFRHDFFRSGDEILCALKESLYTEIVMIHNKLTSDREEIESYLNQLIHFQSAFTVSNLVGSVVVLNEKTHRLKFVDSNNIKGILGDECYERYKTDLQNVQVTSAMVQEAIARAASKKLLAIQEITIPNSFGNKDMTINKASRIGYILDNFLPFIRDAIFDSRINKKIIVIDERIDKRILGISAGLGGAVGNVFELDEETTMLMFSKGTLEGYAKQFMNELNDKLPGQDLDEYRIKVNISDFPRISLHGTEHDMSLARGFLDRLYIYSNQGKELDIETKVKEVIDISYNAGKSVNQYLFRIHTDAIFARFHDDMQKWWMKKEEYYLTQQSNIYEQAMVDVVQSPLLTVHSLMNINHFKKTAVQYHQEHVDVLGLENISTKIINIITNATIPTGIKTWQYLKSRSDYTFINFDYVSNLPANDYNTMIKELQATELNTLIILHENLKQSEEYYEKLKEIANKFKGKTIVIISNEIIAEEFKQYFPNDKKTKIRDSCNNLTDMTDESRETILSQNQIIYQGDKVPLNILIDAKSQPLVTGEILDKLFNNQKIEIGLELISAKPSSMFTTSKYDDIKNNYLDRQLKRGDTVFEVNTLKDIDNPVVVVTGERTAGKHTLLTHIALKTKEIEPKLWISRINLWDYTNDYSRWQVENTNIDLKEAVTFLCRASLKNIGSISIETDVDDGMVILKNRDHITSSSILFELELFIDFINKRNITFLFYGFDEICPHYPKEVIRLLTQLESSRHRFWVTSCPYNFTKNDLERAFGTPYTLEPLTTLQQVGLYEKLWKLNVQLEKDYYEQFNLLQALFSDSVDSDELTENEELSLVPALSMSMHLLYKVCAHILRKEKNWPSASAHQNVQKQLNTYTMLDQFFGTTNQHTLPGQQTGTPLHIYMIANYCKFQFTKIGIDVDAFKKKSKLFTSISGMYKDFLESNLKKFCLEEGILDANDKDFATKYLEERRNFFDKHKKLALFTLYKEDDIAKLMSPSEISEVKDTIKRIETGQEKSGIVSYVINGAPRFVHLAFAEYFAVEYLTDLIRTAHTGEPSNQNKHRALWDFLVNLLLYNSTPELRSFFDYKIKADPQLQELTGSDDCRKIIFEMITKQNSNESSGGSAVNENIKVALNEGLKNLTSLFLKNLNTELSDSDLSNITHNVKLMSSAARLVTTARKDLFNDKVFEALQTVNETKFRELLTSDSVAELPLRCYNEFEKTEDGKQFIGLMKSDLAKLPLSENLVELYSLGAGIVSGLIETVCNVEPKPSTSATHDD